jgi:signal transduction histidine kinase
VSKRLVLAMTSLVALVALALAIPMAVVVATDQRAAFVANLETETLAAASVLSSLPPIDWQARAETISDRTGARVVVVDSERTLLADSDLSGVDRSFDRPEIDDALVGLVASDVRYSNTLATDLRFVAAPVVQNYQVVAAVRLSLPEYDVDDAIQSTLLWLGAFVLSVVIAAALIAWLLARSIASPLTQLAVVAEALPDDLDRRADEGSGPEEVRKVANALNTTAVRLSSILARTQRVAAEASHHLRTPLTGVRLRLEAIEDTASDPEVAGEASAAIVEVDRLTHRIEQILALARSDAGAGEPQTISVGEVLANSIQTATVTAAGKGLELVSATDDDDAFVSAPPGMLEAIIDELIGNAFSYARSTISVAWAVEPSWVSICIEDDGPGLPEEERATVFQRFVRGSNSAPGGSGLGLALVSESAQALGGEVEASSSAFGGLKVTVRLPRAHA